MYCYYPNPTYVSRRTGPNATVKNNTNGPITVFPVVTTDDPEQSYGGYYLEDFPLNPGAEVVINFNRLIALRREEGRGVGGRYELKGNIQGMFLETARVLERVSVEETPYKRFITNREQICRVPVVRTNSTINVSSIERPQFCEITEITRAEYV